MKKQRELTIPHLLFPEALSLIASIPRHYEHKAGSGKCLICLFNHIGLPFSDTDGFSAPKSSSLDMPQRGVSVAYEGRQNLMPLAPRAPPLFR